MLNILAIILKRKKYLFIFIAVTVIVFMISYYLTVWNVYHKSIMAYAEMNGYFFTLTSLLFSLIIAFLSGFYISLLIFRREIIRAGAVGNKAAGFGGALSGLLASGCPSCGTPLLGILGLPLGLFSLPFRGVELKIVSAVFLFLAIYLIIKNIKENLTCQIK